MGYVRSYPEDQHEARVMCLDPEAIAYEWIAQYTKNLNEMIKEDYNEDEYYGKPLTPEKLINIGIENLDGGWEYISRGGVFEGYSLDMTFWDKLEILLKREIPQDDRSSFFSCSC